MSTPFGPTLPTSWRSSRAELAPSPGDVGVAGADGSEERDRGTFRVAVDGDDVPATEAEDQGGEEPDCPGPRHEGARGTLGRVTGRRFASTKDAVSLLERLLDHAEWFEQDRDPRELDRDADDVRRILDIGVRKVPVGPADPALGEPPGRAEVRAACEAEPAGSAAPANRGHDEVALLKPGPL